MKSLCHAGAILLILVASSAQAQEAPAQRPPVPPDMKSIMSATFEAMVPVTAQMTDVMIEEQLKIAIRPGVANCRSHRSPHGDAEHEVMASDAFERAAKQQRNHWRDRANQAMK